MRNLFTALGILFFGLFLAFMIGTGKPAPEKVAESAPAPLQVEVVIASPGAQPITVQSHGVIEARHQFDLLTEVAGQVINVAPSFNKGGTFPAGDVLLRINPLNYEAAVANAEAELAQAEETVASEKARAIQAKREWRDLGSKEANDLFLRKPQLASAQARLDAARLNLQQARYNLGKTRVTLDFPARIIEPFVNSGQYVAKGAKLASIYASNSLQVNLPISQQQLSLLNVDWPLKNGDNLNVTLSAEVGNQKLSWPSTVETSGAVFDNRNQLASLIIKLPDDAQQALPGLYVDAQITGKPQADVLQLPEDSFHDKRFILIAQTDNTIEFRPATFLGRQADKVLLKAQVAAGERIITNRLPLAAPGMPISIKGEAPAANTAADSAE